MAKGYSLDALVKEKWSRYTTSVTTGTDFDNLNTVELSGIYYIPSISLANSLLNLPVKVAGIVEVLPWSNSTGCVIQRFTTYNDGTEWKRSYDGVKWSPWSQTLTSLNVFSVMYPIGIVVQFDNATNPNNSFIGTVWEQIVDGRSARAATGPEAGTADGQIGSVAGSDTTTIAVANMPGHTHGMQNHTHGIASHTHTMAHTHTINHDHGAVNTSSSGAHTHTVSGTAASNGAHTHTAGTGYTGAGNYIGAGTGTGLGTMTTNSAGAHTHSVSGTAASSGAHTHSVDLPNYTGTSGGSSAGNTGGTALTSGGPSNNTTTSTGDGTALNVRNSSHYYAFWKRVA